MTAGRGLRPGAGAHAPFEALSGGRLVLRPAGPCDAGALHRHIDDFAVVRMLARVPWPVARDDVAVFLAGAQARRARGEAADYTILVAPDGAGGPEPAGIVGFEFGSEGGISHVGFWLGRAFWGRGLMTEALRLAIAHMFRSFDIPHMDSGAFDDNPASLHIQRKLGFAVFGEHEVFCRARGAHVRHIDTRLTRSAARAGGLA